MENTSTTPEPDSGGPDHPSGDGATPAPSGPTSASVLASRLTLRTTLMWFISAMVIIVAVAMIFLSPKKGAFVLAGLLAVVGTARLVMPGTPFGLSARNKFWDTSFCYCVGLAIVILANSAHSLK